MINQFKFISKRFGVSAVILSSALLLSACSTNSAPFTGSKAAAESASVATDTAASEVMDEMRAPCMAMHEKMQTKKAEGGEMTGDGMMSDEMKAKHKKCIEAMPEMHEEMHEKCLATHKEKMGDGKMMEGDMNKMHEHCMQMMQEGSEKGVNSEAKPEEGKHQH